MENLAIVDNLQLTKLSTISRVHCTCKLERYEKTSSVHLVGRNAEAKKIATKSDRVVPNYLHTCKNALGYLLERIDSIAMDSIAGF